MILRPMRLKLQKGRDCVQETKRHYTSVPRRAMLYVPSSNPRMLAKALTSPADSICYDLEDSVSPSAKSLARSQLVTHLCNPEQPRGEVMVRINAIGTGYETADLEAVLSSDKVQAIALPKTESADHISWLVGVIERSGMKGVKIVGLIENARGMMRIRETAESGRGYLDGLIDWEEKFAAEDYCADVGLIRSESKMELLYPRSKLVTAAKANGLQAIDLVCVDYQDEGKLRIEVEEGRRLGFDGKQAIHPSQIDIIHSGFSPSQIEVDRALRIKRSYEENTANGRGAYGFEGVMIDAPMYKQALRVLAKGDAADLTPHIEA